ncbi:DUF2989 domain-containing protein [Alteromonas sp. D210916BOD_24]|uniref:DUF2989 domain-containing protein n=1 Tax=Alteromonas sp. D210916BOD_24 TaxID=3157618 RepID=UPI00399D50E9
MLISFIMRAKDTLKDVLFSKFPTNWYLALRNTLLGTLLVALTGCSDLFEPTIGEICEAHSEMCTDLNVDARCREERAQIIRLRYYNKDSKGDAHKYSMLLGFEEYLSCVEVAQHIEHIKHKGKEATRLKGVITAQKEIRRLSRETKNSLDPYLSYYHWSRYNDQEAFRRFERYAASDKVSDPELLVALASVLIKTDQERTINTLYRALSLYTDSEEIDIEIYHSLASIAMDRDNYRLAYVWYGVAEAFDERLPDIQRVQLGERFNLPVNILDSVIEEVVSALKDSTFNAEKLKLKKL